MSTPAEVVAAWAAIRGWLRAHRPDLAQALRPGADAETLAELAAKGLPETWRSWWGENDGSGPVLFDGWSWLPVRGVVDSVVSEHEALLELAEHLAHEAPPRTVGPVQPVWGHRDWVPFAVDFSGCLLCVDLAPAEGGVRGQVVLVDDDERRVLYEGVGVMLSDCLARMEAGVHPDDEPDDDAWSDDGPELAAASGPLEAAPGSRDTAIGTAPRPASGAAAPEAAPRPMTVSPQPSPAELSADPDVRATAERVEGGAEARIQLSDAERADGATVFVRQLTGSVVGVRVPKGAWAGARLRLPGLGGHKTDLVLVVDAIAG